MAGTQKQTSLKLAKMIAPLCIRVDPLEFAVELGKAFIKSIASVIRNTEYFEGTAIERDSALVDTRSLSSMVIIAFCSQISKSTQWYQRFGAVVNEQKTGKIYGVNW